MAACDCVFCTREPADPAALPRPVRGVTEQGVVFWAWLRSVRPLNFLLTTSHGRRQCFSVASLVRVATRDQGAPCAGEDVACTLRTRDGRSLDDLVSLHGTLTASCEPGESCVCRGVAMPLRPAAGRGAKRARTAPPPPSSDGETDMVQTTPGGPYVLQVPPARQAQVDALFAVDSTWDGELVRELLLLGVAPRLHAVVDVYRARLYVDVCCTFVEPSGRLLSGVWLPLTLLQRYYAPHVRHLSH